MDWLIENWTVIVPLIGAVIALFFPQLKPFVDAIIKRPRPTPEPGPDGIRPTPDGDNDDLIRAVIAIQQLIDHFRRKNNPEAEHLARETAKQIFESKAEPEIK